ncbi:hypothetical protein [Saccharopolyspora sp. NPDC002686]|uniref:hypothetical protein n=1 Tax=Saccharopolyspora sp. NPDC002686 TaxID=3154541 RepID=UPI0033175C67
MLGGGAGRELEQSDLPRVFLTDAGLDLINRMVSAHLENERMLLSNLSGDEQATLRELLQRLTAAFE